MPKFLRHIQRRKGFSLIEVLGATAITGIMIFAVASALRSHQISLNTVQRNNEFNEMMSEINLYLTSEQKCPIFMNAMTVVLPPVLATLSSPYKLTSTEAIKMNKLKFRDSTFAELGADKNGLIIQKAQFSHILRNDLAPKGALNRYVLNFEFAVTKKGENYGAKDKVKIWAMYVEVDPAGTIVTCLESNSTPMGKCLMTGKDYDITRYPPCQ